MVHFHLVCTVNACIFYSALRQRCALILTRMKIKQYFVSYSVFFFLHFNSKFFSTRSLPDMPIWQEFFPALLMSINEHAL